MTPEQIEATRPAFEASIVVKLKHKQAPYLIERGGRGEYADDWMNDAWAGWLAAKADAAPGWVACSERLPDDAVLVLVFTPPSCDNEGGQSFDMRDDGVWIEHNNNYEHFCAVAGGCEQCSGPSENAEYTYWAHLPPAPTTPGAGT
jgi:hypothetical protein